MSDMEDKDMEKKPLNESATNEPFDEEFNDSKAKFINGGKCLEEPAVAIEVGSNDDTISFTGLGKEELMKYADDPFWKKVRLVLLILFWVGWIAMLVTAIVIIVLAPRCPYRPDQKWYDKESVYQVYPRSFKDSTMKSASNQNPVGLGMGDIGGLQSKLSYITTVLGMKVIYINSFYKTADADVGLDILDHKKVHPALGTMEEFDKLRKDTKKTEVRLVLDFVPNHTSKNHTWFQKSVNKEDPYTDYYIWKDCNPPNVPNNWKTAYNDQTSAWTYNSKRGQCYLHQLQAEEPDLNLENTKVKQELEEILHFWLRKGVDGFHVVGAEYLFENNSFSDENTPGEFTRNQMKNVKIIKEWKQLMDTYNTKPGKEKALIVTVQDSDVAKMYYSEGSGATLVRSQPFGTNKTASLVNRVIDKATKTSGLKNAWMFGDSDMSRLASTVDINKVKAMLTLQMLLPGVPFNYYGDEISMTDNMNAASVMVDKRVPSRNPFRTPMQWTDEKKNAGFSMFSPWLPVNDNDSRLHNVETEDAYMRKFTTLKVLKSLVALRAKESFQWGELKVYEDGDLVMFTRKAAGFSGYLVVMNLGTSARTEKFYDTTGVSKSVKLVFHTDISDNDVELDLSTKSLFLEANHALVLQYET